jgi:phage terminase small subunit
MVKAKRPPKTLKEKMFVKEYLKTGNATEAAMKAYDVSSYKSANTLGTQTLVKLSIVDIMEKNGLTDDKIATTLVEGMEANKTVRSADPNVESDAESNDFIDIPDWQARLKATELASKIKGHLKEKIEHGGNITLNALIQVNENYQSISLANDSPKGQD